MSKNFDSLFVSYATCDKDCTSWIDLITIRDLEAAILSDSKELVVRIVNLATMKYLKGECVVSERTSHDLMTYTCALTFGPTDHNIKEDIEQGTLYLEWYKGAMDKGGKNFWYQSPACVYYYEKNSKTRLEPTYAYLKHMDNDSAYFNFVNYKGVINRRNEIFYYEEHERARELFQPNVYDAIYAYVKTEVEKLHEFSLATRWPNPWPEEIMPIIDTIKDEDRAAYFLSALIQKSVMESEYEWTVCKVRLPGRERRSLYFYKTGKLKH